MAKAPVPTPQPIDRRIPGGKEPVALDTLVRLLPTVLEEDQALLPAQSRGCREVRTAKRVDVRGGRRGGGRRRLGVHPLGGARRKGRGRLGEHAVTVRCLVAADRSVPDADDAPGNVAIVARAY